MIAISSPSIQSRFVVTLLTNVSKGLLGFMTGLLIARGLAPEQYGVFSFLMASFSALLPLLDMGSSSAFYTFVSKRLRSRFFVLTYMVWLLLQALLLIAFVLLLAPDSWVESIWQGEAKQRIILAFVAVYLQRQAWNFIEQLGESQRLTYKVQLFSLAVMAAHCLLITGFFVLEKLSVEWVFGLMIFEFVVAVVLAWLVLPIQYADATESFLGLLKEYTVFCLPLIPLAWLSVAMGFADTWLLQKYGGSIQQAYYSVGAQIANVSLIATTSVLKILWKEVAEAWAQKALLRVEYLYAKMTRILFFVGTIISGFLIAWSTEIVSLTVGEQYTAGTIAVMIMFLYPVHQSLGQVVSSMYLAMEKTKPLTVLGAIHIALSLIAVYFVLADSEEGFPCLGLGAVGLALKMVVVQFVTVNMQMWWLARIMGWEYHMMYQIIEISLFITLGYLCHYLAAVLLPESCPIILFMGVGGAIYGLSVVVIVLTFPHKVGIENVPQLQTLRRMVKCW